jgi:hypothetical protein
MRKQGIGIGRNSSTGIRRLTSVGIVVALLALVATAAVSLRSSQAKDSAARENSQTSGNTNAHSLRANAQTSFVPQAGQVKPLTQEEAQKLAERIKELVNQSTDGLKTVQHADGSVSMDLEGRFQSIAVARTDEDGKVVQSCVDNREAAAAFFGIDPKLVGVQGNTTSPKTAPVAEKGGDQ